MQDSEREIPRCERRSAGRLIEILTRRRLGLQGRGRGRGLNLLLTLASPSIEVQSRSSRRHLYSTPHRTSLELKAAGQTPLLAVLLQARRGCYSSAGPGFGPEFSILATSGLKTMYWSTGLLHNTPTHRKTAHNFASTGKAFASGLSLVLQFRAVCTGVEQNIRAVIAASALVCSCAL